MFRHFSAIFRKVFDKETGKHNTGQNYVMDVELRSWTENGTSKLYLRTAPHP